MEADCKVQGKCLLDISLHAWLDWECCMDLKLHMTSAPGTPAFQPA